MNALFGSFAVKRLTFVAAKTSSDAANNLMPFRPSEPVTLEVSLKPQGRGALGTLKQVFSKVDHRDGIFEYNGIDLLKLMLKSALVEGSVELVSLARPVMQEQST